MIENPGFDPSTKSSDIKRLDQALEQIGLTETRRNTLLSAAIRQRDPKLFDLSPAEFITQTNHILEGESFRSGNVAERKEVDRFMREDLFEGNMGNNKFGDNTEY